MVGWHLRLNGHEFGWTPGVGDGQGGLACSGSWGRKELDTTELLNWNIYFLLYHSIIILIKKHRLEKSLSEVLEIAILETQLQIKPKERPKQEKSQWFIKAKPTRLLKLSGKDYD